MTHLDDATAIRILRTIAQARLTAPDLTPTPDLRAALALLAEDPVYAGPIEIMSRQPPTGADRYLDPTTIALTTAALLVLQTRIKFKLDHTRKWSLEIDKKAAGDGVLKLLVQRLLPFLK